MYEFDNNMNFSGEDELTETESQTGVVVEDFNNSVVDKAVNDPVDIPVETPQKTQKKRWATKICPVVSSRGKSVVAKYNDKYRLQIIDAPTPYKADTIKIEYQGNIGEPDFEYRYKD